MDGDKNLTRPQADPNAHLQASNTGLNLTRAKSFKVTSGSQNYAQYINTIKAYASAGMPFEHIANAGELLGDIVEREEIDAPLNIDEKVGEIVEDESKLMAWQSRGETISLTHHLPGVQSMTDQKVTIIPQDVVVNQAQPNQTIDVIEGIGVFKENQKPQIPQTNQNSQLENNPYLKVPADLKR